MKDSLGGNAKTLMFVNVSPADFNVDESNTSLQYAKRVKLIKNVAVKNIKNKQTDRMNDVMMQLQEEVGRLEGVLASNNVRFKRQLTTGRVGEDSDEMEADFDPANSDDGKVEEI